MTQRDTGMSPDKALNIVFNAENSLAGPGEPVDRGYTDGELAEARRIVYGEEESSSS
ncbi:hypothetical protein AB0L00_36685 [Actinoallomurus sp. NPDC052308]|uniref:hypothetical protein n=1 Tax=Actinoallomurus sp. NPDC052308 TaxID=3155530 RepID=UPI00342A0444